MTHGFWMGQTEVTQGQWRSVMGTTIVDLARKAMENDARCFLVGETESTFREWAGNLLGGIIPDDFDPANLCGDEDDAIPVYYVTWHDATEYCRRLTDIGHREGWLSETCVFRLPTEAEWEYACRAGTRTALPNGRSIHLKGGGVTGVDEIAWHSDNAWKGFEGKGFAHREGGRFFSRRVGLKAANAWGLHDMLGNVEEWCSDWFGPMAAASATDPAGPDEGRFRVNRGGNWCVDASYCRPAFRSGDLPEYTCWIFGFRVVCAEQ